MFIINHLQSSLNESRKEIKRAVVMPLTFRNNFVNNFHGLNENAPIRTHLEKRNPPTHGTRSTTNTGHPAESAASGEGTTSSTKTFMPTMASNIFIHCMVQQQCPKPSQKGKP